MTRTIGSLLALAAAASLAVVPATAATRSSQSVPAQGVQPPTNGTQAASRTTGKRLRTTPILLVGLGLTGAVIAGIALGGGKKASP